MAKRLILKKMITEPKVGKYYEYGKERYRCIAVPTPTDCTQCGMFGKEDVCQFMQCTPETRKDKQFIILKKLSQVYRKKRRITSKK